MAIFTLLKAVEDLIRTRLNLDLDLGSSQV